MNPEDWSSTTLSWLGVASIAGAIISGPDIPYLFTVVFVFNGIILAMIALSRHFRELEAQERKEDRDGTP
jgi:hypothetical protein